MEFFECFVVRWSAGSIYSVGCSKAHESTAAHQLPNAHCLKPSNEWITCSSISSPAEEYWPKAKWDGEKVKRCTPPPPPLPAVRHSPCHFDFSSYTVPTTIFTCARKERWHRCTTVNHVHSFVLVPMICQSSGTERSRRLPAFLCFPTG